MVEHKAHVSDRKKKVVKELEKLMSKKTVMVASIKNLPASQLQEIRKKLRAKAEMRVIKRNLMAFALKHSTNKDLINLMTYVVGDSVILFSDEDAFELSAYLSDNKSPAKARAGQVSNDDIKVEAGPTELLPGPAITELSQAGLKVKVEGGKIAISEAKILIKNGETITAAKAAILSKLNIVPFKIGLEPVAAYTDGKVYGDVKVDKQKSLDSLKEKYARAVAFAVSLSFPADETIPFIIGKAACHEKAIASLIKSENSN